MTIYQIWYRILIEKEKPTIGYLDMKKKEQKEEIFTTGSGNIFKDFGFSDEEAAGLSIKSLLSMSLQKALRDAGKTQSELAIIIGAPQPKVSDLMSGKMSGFSVERIANYLLRMNYNIIIDVEPASPGTNAQVLLGEVMGSSF